MNKFNTSFNNILSAKLNGENINHIKTDDGIAIKLAKNFNGYNSLIINTNYGIIFLSKDFKELKKIARLKNYNGTTIKEASKKVNKNFKSIKALIAKLNKNINLIDTRGIQVSSNLIDVRSNKIDMRNNNKYISYIDGKIIESAHSYKDNILSYLLKFKNQIAEDIINEELDMNNYIYSYASINKINDKLIINEYKNTSFNVVASKLNEVYPNYKILSDNRIEKIDLRKINYCNNRVDLRKTAAHDVDDRDHAIVLINGKYFFNGETHAQAIQSFLEDNDTKFKLKDDYMRPLIPMSDEKILSDEELSELESEDDDSNGLYGGGTNNKFDTAVVNKYINSLAFAHYCNDDYEQGIFLEEYSLYNITLDEAVKAFKAEYPNEDIYNDDNDDDDETDCGYELLANLRKMNKTAEHDIYNRDYAVAIINGEIYEGNTHAEAVNKFLSGSGKSLNDDYGRPPIVLRKLPDATDEDIEKMDGYYQDMYTVNREVKSIAFAHVCNSIEEEGIFLEQYSLYNITLEEATKILKDKFPNFKIYNDDVRDKEEEVGYKLLAKLISNNLVKVSRLKKQADFYDKNNRNTAILIINGEVLESQNGGEHYDLIKEYFKDKGLDVEDAELLDKEFEKTKFAMGSKVGNKIFFDVDVMISDSITEEEIESILKNKMPDCEVEFINYDADAMMDYVDTYRK